jgi:Cu+-exporting ATPase
LDPEKKTSRNLKNAVFVCPMDPEVREMEPVPCRVCGMALEPAIPSSTDTPDTEYLEMLKRLKISAILAVPLLLIAMTSMSGSVSDMSGLITSRYIFDWIQFLLATPIVFWAGAPLLNRGVASVRQLSPNMFTLIALGVTVAYVFSTFVLLFPSLSLWKTLSGSHDALPLFFEASGVIITLALLGQVLELKARRRTGDSIRELIGLQPENATVVLSDGDEVVVPVSDLEVGAIVRLGANEKIPIDGIVIEGTSHVDESMITGESVPSKKEKGSELFGGTINGNRSLVMRVSKIGDETMISRIVQMVSEAQRSKAPVQSLADAISKFFVPVVVLIAILAFAIWTLLGNPVFGIVAAVSVLIIACPCALGLATPMSIMVGSGAGAQMGVLLKSGQAIQSLSEISVLALDKTGTLTLGKPKVVEIKVEGKFSITEILSYAASVERFSEHPLATAVVDEAINYGLQLDDCADFSSETSIGVTGLVNGVNVWIGRPANEELFASESRSVIEVRLNSEKAGFIFIEDPISKTARIAIESLGDLGIRPIVLTGDSFGVARKVCEELGINEFHSGLLPSQKARIIAELKHSKEKVGMIGDGVNDAPALATADVGIAVGSGTAAAIETADITLLGGRISDVSKAVLLTRKIMTNIRQNLFFAFAYNVIGIPIAAGVLYPWLGLLLSPMVASLAMTFSSVSVIANALRLRKTRL